MQILSPHHEKHKIGENFNNRKNDTPRGDPWACGGRKKFLSKFCKQTIYSEFIWVLITKNTKLEKILTIEKMTPQGGPLNPKNANFASIEFRAELARLVIYILVVYEEYIIKSSNFNIRKNSRVRVPPLVFRGHFLHPSKSTLRSNCPV